MLHAPLLISSKSRESNYIEYPCKDGKHRNDFIVLLFFTSEVKLSK